MNREMMQLTLAIVAKALFDADVKSEAEDIGRTITVIVEMFPRTVLPFSEILDFLPLPSNRFERARGKLDAIIYRMISERCARGKYGGDLLSISSVLCLLHRGLREGRTPYRSPFPTTSDRPLGPHPVL